jgi:hypothetical protein
MAFSETLITGLGQASPRVAKLAWIKSIQKIDHAKKMAGVGFAPQLHVSSLNAITLIQVCEYLLQVQGP